MRSSVKALPTSVPVTLTPSGASSSFSSATTALMPCSPVSTTASSAAETLLVSVPGSVNVWASRPATERRYSLPPVRAATCLAEISSRYFPSSGSGAAKTTLANSAVAGAGSPSGRLTVGLVVGWLLLSAKLLVTFGAPSPV